MKGNFLSLLFLLPMFLPAQEVIMSGEALYNTNFSLINSSIMGATIKSKSGTKGVNKKSSPAKLEFVRSESLSQNIQKDFISRLSKEQPAFKPALEKAFSGNKLRGEFDRLLAGYGYFGTNIADAMTAYLVISWQVVNGVEYNDRNGFDSVRDMIRNMLLSSSYLENVSDRDKQTVSETFAYQSMIAMNTYKVLVAKRDNKELEKFKTSVDNNLKQSGMDLKNVKLTAKGFLKK